MTDVVLSSTVLGAFGGCVTLLCYLLTVNAVAGCSDEPANRFPLRVLYLSLHAISIVFVLVLMAKHLSLASTYGECLVLNYSYLAARAVTRSLTSLMWERRHAMMAVAMQTSAHGNVSWTRCSLLVAKFLVCVPLLILIPQVVNMDTKWEVDDDGAGFSGYECIQVQKTWVGNCSVAAYIGIDLAFLWLFLVQMKKSFQILKSLQIDCERLRKTSRLADLQASDLQVRQATIRNVMVAFLSSVPTIVYYGVINNLGPVNTISKMMRDDLMHWTYICRIVIVVDQGLQNFILYLIFKHWKRVVCLPCRRCRVHKKKLKKKKRKSLRVGQAGLMQEPLLDQSRDKDAESDVLKESSTRQDKSISLAPVIDPPENTRKRSRLESLI